MLSRLNTSRGKAVGFALLALIVIMMCIPAFASNRYEPLIILEENKMLLKVNDKKKPTILVNQIYKGEDEDGILAPDVISFLFPEWMKIYAQMSSDKSKLFYIGEKNDDGVGTLYYYDLNQKVSSSMDKKGRLLATGISYDYTISSDGSQVVYMKQDSDEDEGTLYIHNLSKEAVIDTDITRYWFSDHSSVIYYTKSDSNEEEALFFIDTVKIGKPVKIDSNIALVEYFDEESGIIYYSKNNTDKPMNSNTLYSKGPNSDKAVLLQEFESIVTGMEHSQFYYTLTDEKQGEALSFSLYLYANNQSTKVTDHYKKLLFSNAAHRTILYQKDEPLLGANDKVEEESSLPDSFGEELTPARYVVVNKPTDMDFIIDPFNDGTQQSTIYISGKSSSGSLLVEEGTSLLYAVLSADGKQLYTHESVQSRHQLVSYELVKGVPANRKVIAEDIYKFEYIPEDSTLLYFKNIVDNSSGELYRYLKGGSHLVSNDVVLFSATYYPKDGLLLYTKDRDFEAGTFQVYGYKGKRTFQVADRAAAYYYTEGSMLYYLDNFDVERGNGELKKYNEKREATLVHKGAYALFPLQHGYLF